MNRNYLFLFIFCLFVVSHLKSQSFNNPVSYLEFVGNEQQNITKTMWQYTKAVAHSKSDRAIENKRNTVVKSIQRAILRLKKQKVLRMIILKKKFWKT